MDDTQKTDLDILTDALDLSELPVEEQEEMLVEIQDLVKQGVVLKILEQMDDATREEFSKFMDALPDEDEIADYLYTRVPNADELVKETIEDFANDILAVSKE